MHTRSLLTCALASTLLLGASSCKSGKNQGSGGSKKKKNELVAEEPVLDTAHHLLISEIVPHAEHSLLDADGDASDWIELHNFGSEAVPLGQFALSDDKKEPLKWTLPERTLDPGAFVIVFASGKDRSSADGELHSNFKLDNNGEYLALVSVEDRQAVHTFAPIYPKVPKGRSYGYGFVDGSVAIDRLVFFDTPTPGAANEDSPTRPDTTDTTDTSGGNP